MLHFQLARIHEVNLHLRALMEASERGLPSHFNLAIRPTVSSNNFSSKKNMGADPEEQGRVIERLKDQNHQLTEVIFFFFFHSSVSLLYSLKVKNSCIFRMVMYKVLTISLLSCSFFSI